MKKHQSLLHMSLMGVCVLALAAGLVVSGCSSQKEGGSATKEPVASEASTPDPAEDPSVPSESRNALKKARTYAETMHMSYAAIAAQLVSPNGEKFSQEAADYAMAHLEVDWNANALAAAENYSTTMHMSRDGIYNQLTSAFDQYTPEQAQYAIDNLQADWKANALEKAKTYQETMNMSPQAIYDQLTSQFEGFTAEEAQYAIDNLS